MAYNARFNFIGEVVIPKNFLKEWTTDYGTHLKTMNFGVKESNVNMQFVNLFFMEKNEIVFTDENKEKVSVPWAERLNPKWVERAPSYRKIVIDLGEGYERKEYLSEYDAIMYLNEVLPKYEGKILVTGTYKRNTNTTNQRFLHNFNVKAIYGVAKDKKNKLSLTLDMYYNNDCVDKACLSDSGKVFLNGYFSQYVNSDIGEKFIPITTVYDNSKLDMSNPKHKALDDYMMKFVDVRHSNMMHIPWECEIVKGEEVEFDESMLTDAQKLQVELGIADVDDFKPTGIINGENLDEIRLKRPLLKGDSENGLVDSGMTFEEFEKDVFVMGYEEPTKAPAPDLATDTVDDDIEDLFDGLM